VYRTLVLRGHRTRLALCGMCCVALAVVLCGCEVWVDDDYTETDCGGHNWQQDAFTLIQDGLDAMLADELGTVHVYDGVYPENLTVDTPSTVAGEGAVTIAPASGDTIVFAGTVPVWGGAMNVTIGGTGTGVVVQAVPTSLIELDGTVFGETLAQYIRVEVGGVSVDAEDATFLGAGGAAVGGAEIEAKVRHKFDDPSLGRVFYADERTATTLTMSNVAAVRGEAIWLCAQLGGGAPAGQVLSFWVDGAQVGTGTTDGAGIARCPYTIDATATNGDHVIAAIFGGNTGFAANEGEGVLTVTVPPTSLTLTLSPASVASGGTVTAAVMGDNGVDYSKRVDYGIPAGAGGSWAENVYTSATAGSWTVHAIFGGLTCSAALTVTHGDISGLSISPAAATITTAGSQAYAVQAVDIAGNVWVPDAASYTWDEDGAGGFTGNAYTPDAADAGHNVSIRAIAGSVQSNAASLHVYGVSGAGLILAWDKDDQSFYLCQNPANPASAGALGLVPATNGWHDVNGVRVLVSGAKGNRTVAVANTAGISNSLQVRWYMRSGAVYNAYAYSTIAGTTKSAVYGTGRTYVDGSYKSGFWGLLHSLDAADPTDIRYGAEQQ